MKSMASNELESFISGLDKTGNAQPKVEQPEKGQYFIDQATGQYYFQSGDGEAMAIVANEEAEAAVAAATAQSAQVVGEQATANENQVVMSTGGDQYQTVTIVPSDGK